MVFNCINFDSAQDSDEFDPASAPTPTSSPSATLCQPCQDTCTFARSVVSRILAAGASLVSRAPASKIDGHEIRVRSLEMPLHNINSNVCPEFPHADFALQLVADIRDFSKKILLDRRGFRKVFKGQSADIYAAAKRLKKKRIQDVLVRFTAEVWISSINTPVQVLHTLHRICSASECGELLYIIRSVVRPEFNPGQLKLFALKELNAATRNFSDQGVIDTGGFGKVYKGQIADGSLVSIKRCKVERTRFSVEQFETEVMIGSIIPSHHNLLPLLGFCRASRCGELLLVYPLMTNKSVASCLFERPQTEPPLDWPTRRKIATGAARGLSHLHDLNIVHRDVKPSNILLDEEFKPYIGDFGFARFVDSSPGGYYVDCIEEAPVLPRKGSEEGSHSKYPGVTTNVVGTMGYLAPECLLSEKCSANNDVYSFGITLIELVSGQRFCDLVRLANDSEVMLSDFLKEALEKRSWEILIDSDLQGAYDEEELKKVIQLAALCGQFNPFERPSMAEVVRFLEGQSIEKRWEEWRRQGNLFGFEQAPGNGKEMDSTSFLSSEELSDPE